MGAAIQAGGNTALGQAIHFPQVTGPALHDFTNHMAVQRCTGGEFELRSEEHTSELQSRENLVCRLLLEKKKINHLGVSARTMGGNGVIQLPKSPWSPQQYSINSLLPTPANSKDT